jgi:hypothetical protein
VATFLTDSFRDDFTNVWGKLYKVELINSAGVATTVFEDTAGKTVDFKTLRDAAGARFLFLGNNVVPVGAYTKIRVTIDAKMTVFQPGVTGGTDVTMANALPRDGQGHVAIEHTFPAPKNVGSGNANVVVDFDLANFVLVGTQLTPAIKEGQQVGINDDARHEHDDYKGTVSSLSGTAPALTFTLTPPRGNAFTVVMDANTNLFNASGAASPILVNGKRVEVRGVFDGMTGSLLATDVKIEDEQGNEGNLAEVFGAPSSIDAGAGTFQVEPRECEGLVPSQRKVNVVTNANTVFRGDSGLKFTAAEFFAKLATTPQVKVEGTYNKDTNTLTAKHAKIRTRGDGGGNGGGGHHGGGNNDPREGEAKGTAASVNAEAKTLSLNPVTEFEGFTFGGGALSIITNNTTTYANKNGAMSAADFFAALTANTQVAVKGSYLNGTLTATRLKIVN